MKTIILLLLLHATVFRAGLILSPDSPPPTDSLLEQICAAETRRHPEPGRAVNQHGSAWGRCQVKYWSAILFGGFDDEFLRTGIQSRDPWELFDYQVNTTTAGRILAGCRADHGTRNTRLLVYCYGAGRHSEPYTNREHRYWSKQIAADHAHTERRLAFQHHH